jgi:hypothetical protein
LGSTKKRALKAATIRRAKWAFLSGTPCERQGCKELPCTLPSLRYSHVSELLSREGRITAVAERLGHANPNIRPAFTASPPADNQAGAKLWDGAMGHILTVKKTGCYQCGQNAGEKTGKAFKGNWLGWSGRRGSNPRRSAWENPSRL